MSEKCKGVNAAGEPCGNYALDNSEYCRLHEPPKTEQGELALQELKIEKPPVKQIVRYISRDGAALEGSWRVEWIDDYLIQYIKSGYRLHTVTAYGQNEWGVGYLYVLVLE